VGPLANASTREQSAALDGAQQAEEQVPDEVEEPVLGHVLEYLGLEHTDARVRRIAYGFDDVVG
jgi:hypothetical protein